MATTEDLIYRLRKRAEIRRNDRSRRSLQEGKPDRISDLLEEAAAALEPPKVHDVEEYYPMDEEEESQGGFFNE